MPYTYLVIHPMFRSLLVFFCVAMLFSAAGCASWREITSRTFNETPAPGPLYTAEFYRTATPEAVRAEIGGRRLEPAVVIREVKTSYPRYYGKGSSSGGTYYSKDYAIPLDLAIANTPYPEVITLLCQSGLYTDSPNEHPYFNPVDHALYRKDIDIIRAVLQCPLTDSAKVGALFSFAYPAHHDLKYFPVLLESGIDVNMRAGGVTVLEKAISQERDALIDYILRQKLTAETLDSTLWETIRRDKYRLTEKLIDLGANPYNRRWREDRTALRFYVLRVRDFRRPGTAAHTDALNILRKMLKRKPPEGDVEAQKDYVIAKEYLLSNQ